MNSSLIKTAALLFLVPVTAFGQNGFSSGSSEDSFKKALYGFVRGGFYTGIDDNDDKLYIPSAFSDFALKLEAGDEDHFRGFADMRFRYGTEFREPVSRLDLREAYITVKGKKWDVSTGQKIIKWGRADFTNPTQKLSPQNLISRSTDHEDMDMGNLLMEGRWHPSPLISMEAVAVPFYRSSTLLIKPLDLPSYVSINQIENLLTDKGFFSYGLRADLHLRGVDIGLSWFDGYDPMPGVRLTGVHLDTTGYIPSFSAEMTMTPYKIRNAGIDFEAALGSVGIRGEAAWTFPMLSYKTNEYVPLEEIKWVAGIDWMKGNWRITGEYSGKTLPGFIPSPVEPSLLSEPDLATLAMMMSIPGFSLEDYMRQQVGAFNRLYNYQIERSYHSGGIRLESDLFYGRLTPSVTALYNFTSHDLMLMPEVIYKPVDGLTIVAGGEFLSGRKSSLYDIVDEFMNGFRLGFKVNF